jgi:hypothetical protein
MRRFIISAGVWCAVLAWPSAGQAGLYHPDVLIAFDIDDNGYAIPFSLDSFLTLVNIAGEADARPANIAESDRHKELVAAVEKWKAKDYQGLSPRQVCEVSGELLRLRRDPWAIKDALNLLQKSKSQPPEGYEFVILTQLAHAHLLNPEGRDYGQIYELEYSAVKDYEFPKALANLNAAQLRWYRRLERDYYLPFLRHRREEAAKRRPSIQDGLDPIFPGPAKKGVAPVNFVGESGRYEAAAIADAERAKFPPDAIAILQQMILWDPDDNRLWWQLGEVYNATGDLKSAGQVFNLLLDIQGGRKYTNRELMEHNAVVSPELQRQLEIEAQFQATRKRVEEERRQRAEDEKRHAEERKFQRRLLVGVGVGLFLAFVSYWQTREFIRRRQARRARIADHVE